MASTTFLFTSSWPRRTAAAMVLVFWAYSVWQHRSPIEEMLKATHVQRVFLQLECLHNNVTDDARRACVAGVK